MVASPVTLVLGASTNPERYAYKAIVALRQKGHAVVAVGAKEGQVMDVAIQTQLPKPYSVDTVSLYLGPDRQKEYIDALIALEPQRVIFNPGTENPLFSQQLIKAGIRCENACTLVLLATNQYQSQES
jgi:predicted CoA-binding protein